MPDRTSWGPNLLDEEAAVKVAMGMSSLTSPGFTRLSNESGLFAFTYCRNFRDESVRVFHQCLASSTGRRTIGTDILQPILLSSCRAWCTMENAWFPQMHLSHSSAVWRQCFFFVRARCLLAGPRSWGVLADQQGIESPPAVWAPYQLSREDTCYLVTTQ